MPTPIATHLMFDGKAEEAMNFYVSLFKDSKVTAIERYGPGEPGPEGTVKRADFLLAGHRLICIDSPVKHDFTFTPAMSIFADCDDEADLTQKFEKLSAGGQVFMPRANYCSDKVVFTGQIERSHQKEWPISWPQRATVSEPYGFSTRFGWCSDCHGVSWPLNLP